MSVLEFAEIDTSLVDLVHFSIWIFGRSSGITTMYIYIYHKYLLYIIMCCSMLYHGIIICFIYKYMWLAYEIAATCFPGNSSAFCMQNDGSATHHWTKSQFAPQWLNCKTFPNCVHSYNSGNISRKKVALWICVQKKQANPVFSC